MIYFSKKSPKHAVFAFNCIFFTQNNLTSSQNLSDLLQLVNDQSVRSSDAFIFNLIKFYILANQENIKEAFGCLQRASKYKKLHKFTKNEIEVFQAFSPQKQNQPLDSITDPLLYALNCGFYYKNSNYIKSGFLERIYHVYLPLLATRNLIMGFLGTKGDSKVILQEVIDALDLNQNELHYNLLLCIDKGLIRGFLSLERNILVLSKALPFPDLLN